jgi:hypothetical protein
MKEVEGTGKKAMFDIIRFDLTEGIDLCLFVSSLVQLPSVDQGLLIHEITRSHTATHHTR